MPSKKVNEDPAERTMMKGRTPFDLGLEHLIDIIEMVSTHKQLADLRDLAKKDKLRVKVPVNTVNAVKDFVAKRSVLATDPIGKKVLSPQAAEEGDAVVMSLRVGCCGFSSDG